MLSICSSQKEFCKKKQTLGQFINLLLRKQSLQFELLLIAEILFNLYNLFIIFP